LSQIHLHRLQRSSSIAPGALDRESYHLTAYHDLSVPGDDSADLEIYDPSVPPDASGHWLRTNTAHFNVEAPAQYGEDEMISIHSFTLTAITILATAAKWIFLGTDPGHRHKFERLTQRSGETDALYGRST
jgi:hypothetical protein